MKSLNDLHGNTLKEELQSLISEDITYTNTNKIMAKQTAEGHQEIPLFRAKQGRVQKNNTAMNKKVTERSV